MLENAKAAAGVNTKVVAVTVLTSLDDGDLLDIGVGGRAEDQVARLADLARSAGLDGIVCSGEEVALAKKAWPDGFFVVPGVRPAGGAKGDQKRADQFVYDTLKLVHEKLPISKVVSGGQTGMDEAGIKAATALGIPPQGDAELIDTVWNGRAISEAAFSSRINGARRVLGDNGTDQLFIRTLHRRGFRFVADVQTVAAPDADAIRLVPDETAVAKRAQREPLLPRAWRARRSKI